MTLIEVIISAMLVALIAVGTLTGFDSASRATADERQHNQATLLAGQDEERLRGMNVTELGRLGTATSSTVENGTTYTVESKAQFISAAKEKASCEGGTADYIQTTSQVSWPSLGRTNSAPETVAQSSIVPVPISTSLLVNVHDEDNEPVEGATVRVKGATMGTVEQTTPASGCVIFGALPDSEVTITATKAGWINEQGEAEPPATEASLSATSLVTASFNIAEPGSLVAEFVSNGLQVGVTGDTIYVSHTGLSKAITAGTANSYAASVTATGLYPFATPGKPPTANQYTAYAGDCSGAEPAKFSQTDPNPQIEPGEATKVLVEVPAINVLVYEGATEATKGALDGKAEGILTNVTCGTTRTAKTTSTGTLERKYQPYGKYKLCLQQTISGNHYRYQSSEITSSKKEGTTPLTILMSASGNKTNSTC